METIIHAKSDRFRSGQKKGPICRIVAEEELAYTRSYGGEKVENISNPRPIIGESINDDF